ncbi:UPF0280 family protein [Parasulfitobacter algicola]|uniref:UPF0280 family protein n=1 Tax=Parasulfitobacter algicola TaxID=2614809 RepID=A0ABX2IV12_9RHOB|nr:UPF0280 family protein [Sulfitobacter algicola]NSX56747.1 UPF0280 family protein [Sulfitobacter algicola]
MTGPHASLLHDGQRLHLQHGPIDLIVHAEGDREAAFDAASDRFSTILTELVEELDVLRCPMEKGSRRPDGDVARRMCDAARFMKFSGYLTPMAAVAGSVADEVLDAMRKAGTLHRGYVNNGGDIALHLSPGEIFKTEMRHHDGQPLGQIVIKAGDGIGGIATSGRHGRSLSMGIADSVTVLARTAALADVSATLIANAVDLPGHAAVTRCAAHEIDDQSDLGTERIVTGCARLSHIDCERALSNGLALAERWQHANLILGAAIFLQGHSTVTMGPMFSLQQKEQLYV